MLAIGSCNSIKYLSGYASVIITYETINDLDRVLITFAPSDFRQFSCGHGIDHASSTCVFRRLLILVVLHVSIRHI